MTVGDATPYDVRLPILHELELEIAAAARRRLEPAAAEAPDAIAVQPAPATPARGAEPPLRSAPHAGTRSRRSPRRSRLVVPRRALLLAAITCLVGASATATVTVWSEGEAEGGGRQVLAEAGSGADKHRLQVHSAGSRVCATFLLPDAVDTVCEPPPRGNRAIVRTVVSPFTRYVYGLAGPAAVSVAVEAGPERAATRPRPVPPEIRSAVPPARGLRWFIVPLPRGDDDAPTVAHVAARGAAAESRTVVDCSLGQLDGRCDGG
jgi:hypothetical protein